jgi:hypothetical protein
MLWRRINAVAQALLLDARHCQRHLAAPRRVEGFLRDAACRPVHAVLAHDDRLGIAVVARR